MPSGERIKMRLCEMGSLVGSGKDATWMRQVRKPTASDQPDQHRFRITANTIGYTYVQPVVSGKLFQLHDATL